ncbi:MAG: hypothetical protein [crAssphage sp. isolate ctcc615]|uniref:Uncharacterized protein n=1 Tax=crAssphage sp. isolate ctcc615 TaxID=2989853 RepID=A0A345BNZ9_9CAUD|nr:MAG: hypothetical protein KNU00_gp44 [crAssphage sp. isolate ctcc615]AXF52170.1 MAG: hypothetical protein [crAssphage sp. isolate ctcc615]
METIKATVKAVRMFINEDNATVTLTLDKAVKGFKRTDAGTFEEAETDTISFFRSALTAQLCDVNDDIALFRSMSEHAFGQREFGAILFGAKLTLEREFKAAGEVVGERAIQRDCYITTITGITLSAKAVAALDKATAL